MLTGKMTAASTFAADDHRNFNRHGEAFDVGETFSGVPYDVALQAVEELRPLVPQGATMAQFALRWILMEEAATVVIPGARTPAQSIANAGADALPPLPAKPRWRPAARSMPASSRPTSTSAGDDCGGADWSAIGPRTIWQRGAKTPGGQPQSAGSDATRTSRVRSDNRSFCRPVASKFAADSQTS
jgi:hypothetical protein